MVFFTITWKTTYTDKSILRNIVASYQTRTHHRLFAGINPFPKTSRNCLCWSHFLIETQDYSLLPRALLNSATDDFMKGVLKQLHQKNWKISRKIYVVEFPLNTNAQIQSTAYYQTKNSTADNFLKVVRKKRLF